MSEEDDGFIRIGKQVFYGIPLVYVIGFVAWGVYERSTGLGFLALNPAQYLSTGVLALVFMTYIFLVNAVGSKLLAAHHHQKQGSNAERIILGLLVAILSFILGTGTFVAMFYAMALPSLDIRRLTIWLVIVSFLLIPLVFWVDSFVFRNGKKSWLPEPLDIKGIWKKVGGHDRRPRQFFTLLSLHSMVQLGVVCVLMFSLVFLPAMEPEFGGARTREAFISLDTAYLTVYERTTLFPNATQPDDGIMDTVLVTVYADLGQRILFRLSDDPGTTLYDIRGPALQSVRYTN